MTTLVEQLRARRRVTAASRARRPAKLPPIEAPPAAVSSYTAALVALNRELDAAIARELAPLDVRVDAADGDAPSYTPTQVARVRARLLGFVERLIAGPGLARIVGTVAERTVTRTRSQWFAQVKALGIDLSTDVDTAAAIKVFRRENVKLIKSMLTYKVQQVHRVLREAGAGTRVETIAKRIRETTDASPAKAALLARDQVLKLNAQVTADRHKAAGITEYVWRSSRDERVRKRHKQLDGTRHAYDDPPVVDPVSGRRAHPGEDYQCRCTAEPVIPGFDD